LLTEDLLPEDSGSAVFLTTALSMALSFDPLAEQGGPTETASRPGIYVRKVTGAILA